MKAVLSSLAQSIPSVMHVTMVLTIILLVFGILGVQIFAGKFAACEEPLWTTKVSCEGHDAMWSNPSVGHFDNVFIVIPRPLDLSVPVSVWFLSPSLADT